MIPTSGKAEWHLTYRCDLECMACNRASFLRDPHTADMTLEDARSFCDQADALGWKPRIVIIGGEPALVRHLEEFALLARRWSGDTVQIYSNGHTPKTRERLIQLRRANMSVPEETWKTDSIRSVDERREWVDDVFVSPADLGIMREPCYQHASIICGVSVDHEGYAPCAMGGAIEALLHVGGRTRRLADLFSESTNERMTRALCKHCGHNLTSIRPDMMTRVAIDAQERRFGTPMSPTWVAAFEGRR